MSWNDDSTCGTERLGYHRNSPEECGRAVRLVCSYAHDIKVRRGKVAMSIDPPFTWEAIMEPNKVDELIRTLHQAAADARRMVGGTA